MFRITLGVLAMAVLGTAFGAPLSAEPYRLVIGDKMIVSYDLRDDPKATKIDLDGNIRLAQLGNIMAAGRTLDEVENAITEGMIQGGFSGVSFVSVEVAEYAPVIVSGFVERSGRYDYLPGMTVGVALAIAGGLGSGDAEGPNSDILAVNARRRAAAAAENIADAVADIAALEAALAGPDTPVVLDPALRAAVPVDLRDGMDARIDAKAELVASERRATENLVASWTQEVADFEEQLILLDGRIVLKQEIVTTMTEELANLDSLRSQGLTTTARFSTLQQRLADDREELLTLETAKIAARRAAAGAKRNRDQLLANQLSQRLEDLEDARARLQAGQRDHRFALNELTVLSDDTEALANEQPVFDIAYRIGGPRADRIGDATVDRATPMLPGDVLIVEVLDPFASGN